MDTEKRIESLEEELIKAKTSRNEIRNSIKALEERIKTLEPQSDSNVQENP